MGTRWGGIEERPLDGIVRLRLTSYSILGLCSISVVACSIMVILGRPSVLIMLAWLPLIGYLFLCGVWAGGLTGFVVWRIFTIDRTWARFWLDEGNLEVEIESRLGRDLIPFHKECRWSYATHYLLPEGIEVGVMRFFNDRMTENVLLLVEGVNEANWDLVRDVLEALGDVDISEVSVIGRPVHAPTPWGYTSRV
jgi:hypothetical protein